MFEKMGERAALLGDARAARRRGALRARIAEVAPGGVEVVEEGEAVVLLGRGLSRRFAGEAELRWLVAEARNG